MNENTNNSIGEQNVERLLHDCYNPETPSPEFAGQVRRAMLDAARKRQLAERADVPAEAPTGQVRLNMRRTFAWAALATAAAVLVGVMIQSALNNPRDDGNGLVVRGNGSAGVLPVPIGPEGLMPMPVTAVAVTPTTLPSSEIATKARERRRITLPEGSVLYVNQNTRLTVESPRVVRLHAGEVFVEVAPMTGQDGRRVTFTVATPQRTVQALGTKFAVTADAMATRVAVTHGKVAVDGQTQPLYAGRQLSGGRDARADRIVSIPLATHLLEWTRELMAAAQTPLVPASNYEGGALVALDPNGQEAKLSLRQYKVDVHIEDGFARTTIDQTYFNHMYNRLEGTFYFPLPPDASISRLAMYVDGKLMEGGMAEREQARYVFEDIMYTRRDPALLEWVDGTTFKMRVFPLEPRQEKRIILSYAQRLESLEGKMSYRFPGGHNLPLVNKWSFHARVVGGAQTAWNCDGLELTKSTNAGDLLLDAQYESVTPNFDVVLNVDDPAPAAGAAAFARFSTATHEGNRYLMLRYRPDLSSAAGTVAQAAQPPNRDWVFLFESSGDRDPLVARAQIDVLKTMLSNAEFGDRFAVLTAGTHVAPMAEQLQPVTPQAIASAVEWLEKTHLIGALDLEGGLAGAAKFLREGRNAHLVHVGSGIAVLGERGSAKLAALVPAGAHYVGIGVGKRWGRDFMKEAAAHTGGFFTQINPDENIAWRAQEVTARLNTARLMDVKVATVPAGAAFMGWTDSVSAGEEICAVARLDAKGPLPTTVTVTGTLDGQPWTQTLAVLNPDTTADYLPRFWAKLEIDRRLAEDGTKNHDQIVALSKAMYVMSPFTSLLVLENDTMYEQYKVDRGRKDHWALYPAPAKIDVVNEWNGRSPAAAPAKTDSGKPTAQQVLGTILVRLSDPLFRWPNQNYYGGGCCTAADLLSGNVGDWYGYYADFAFAEKSALKLVSRREGESWNSESPPSGRRLIDHLEGLSTIDELRGLDRSNAFGMPQSGASPGRGGKFAADKPAMRQPTSLAPRVPAGGPAAATPPLSLPMPSLSIGSGARMMEAGKRRPVGPSGHQLADLKKSMYDREGRFDARGGWMATDQLRAIGLNLTKLDLSDGYLGREGLDKFEAVQNGHASLLYQRPSVNSNWQYMSDLLGLAEGMNTSLSDIYAVVEAESEPVAGEQSGKIDPRAKALIDKARQTPWRSITLTEGGVPCTIAFDGAGRYVWWRTNAVGLRERVVCDGQTILHLYEELGVGARRTNSRFHRADFAGRVPLMVLPAEDMARGCDVALERANVVSVTATGAADAKDADGKPLPYAQWRLLFNAADELIGRELVQMPTGKTLWKQSIDSDGVVKTTAADGRTQNEDLHARSAKAPELSPGTEGLVVLALPYRTPTHLAQDRKVDTNAYEKLSADDALALAAGYMCYRNGEPTSIITRRFFAKGDRRIGLYAMMLTSGNWNPDTEVTLPKGKVAMDPVKDHPGSALARYIREQAVAVNTGNAKFTAPSASPEDFGDRLAQFRYFINQWTSGRANSGDQANRTAEATKALAFVNECQSPVFAFAMLSVMQNYGISSDVYKPVAAALQKIAALPGLGYTIRYEAARVLLQAGDSAGAAAAFEKLYREASARGELPAIDGQFMSALAGVTRNNSNAWAELIRETGKELIAKERVVAAVMLAWQVHLVGDAPLAEDLLNQALDGVPSAQAMGVRLAGVVFLRNVGNYARADSILDAVLADPEQARRADLWRLASALADARGRTGLAIKRLEKALDIEFAQRPEVVNIQAVRSDYQALLTRYEQQAQALVTLEKEPSKELTARVVQAADRWRWMDPDDLAACQGAARVLNTLGDKEMAWEYLTTPLATKPNEAQPWVGLAQTLRQQGDFDLADRAYAAAFEAEGTNAQILWDRAQMLQQNGRVDQARELYRKIANGTWPRQFSGLAAQAKQYINK